MNLNEDIYSLGFASLIRNETIDEVVLKDEAKRPDSSFVPQQTPRGSYMGTPKMGTPGEGNYDEQANRLDEDAIY